MDAGAVLWWVLVVVVAVAAAAVAVAGFGRVRRPAGPLVLVLTAAVSARGGTVLALPPLGRVRVRTHAGPLALRVGVDDVDPERARALLAGSASSQGIDPDALLRALRPGLVAAVRALALRCAALGAAAAALTCAVAFRDAGAALAGAGAAVLALGAAGGIAAATARPRALRDPVLTGLLARLPALLGGLRDTRAAFGTYSRRVAELSANAVRLHARMRSLPQEDLAGSTRLVWISDVHNNPGAYELVRVLVEHYGAAAVLDTGDSTDLGTAVEERAHADLATLAVPYVWVRGNHDSAGTQAHRQRLPGVHVLDGTVAEVAGLRIAGIGDPRFTPVQRVQEGRGVAREELRRAGERLAEVVAACGAPVDVALVHEPAMAPPLFGRVPLVLDGHVHARRSRRVEGTLELTQGSSGGAGLRAMDGGTVRPLELSVLHVDPGTRRLLAVDEVTVGGVGEQRVTVERREAAAHG